MSAAAALPRRAAAPSSAGTLAGFGPSVRFILRRNWLRLLVWAVVLALMIPIVYTSQQAAFPTQADRNAYANVANTPAIAAMTGLPYAAGSLGGILVIKIWMTLAVALGLASIFLVARNGRADEEAGRTELLRGTALGRHAFSLANYAVAGGLCVVTGLLISLLALQDGLPAAGSWVLGGSVAGVGLAFVGIAAPCGQLSSTGRGANSLGVAVLAVTYLVRAVGDVNAGGTQVTALSWFSPIGWGQNMRPFAQDTWWPFLALLALAAAGCLLALGIESRRDVGLGLVAAGRGPARATAFLASPLGLSLRLQRATLISWLCGAVVAGLFFGGVAKAMTTVLDPSNAYAQAFLGGSRTLLDGVLGTFVLFIGLLAGAFAVQSLSGARAEESGGRLEPQLAGSLARSRWLGAHVAVAAGGSAAMLVLGGWLAGVSSDGAATAPALAGAALAYWPAVLVMMGVLLFLHGFAPRLGTGLGWAVYGISVVVAMFGPLLSLSDSAIKATPFGAVPRMPADGFALPPLLLLASIALVLGILGMRRFSTRDIMPE
ncbi:MULTISPECIES: ABC transporter permease [unclassified Arthrobacter]|uniref:ABC transporter permease n=1 Tax=unclassified Arthrobacter TaxID=235627 RepID=UPI00159EA45B|nr:MULTISPECIES: ABC transporter permease [unclassified Arthrobacter]MCQ9166142.1 ABC transporter permease [Arthrobacter sp. STN4]NVN00738.1 ABC transporter permease [Arthrobacter sp. SDTb3-6]